MLEDNIEELKNQYNMQVGQRIQDARKEKGYTQRDLGLALGVNHKTVSKYETGEVVTTTWQIKIIAKELGVSTSYLLEGTTEDAVAMDNFHKLLALPIKKREFIYENITMVSGL